MKSKLIKKYIAVFTAAVFAIIILWIIFTYVFIFSGNVVDTENPQYLVNSFEQYIDFENDIAINEAGQKILKNNGLWSQVIDNNGLVIYDYNSPNEAKTEYTIFEMCYYAMNSDTLGKNTIFIKEFAEHDGYGIVIGCDSSKVSKVTFKFTGSVLKNTGKSIFILCVIAVLIVFISGYIFSQSIAQPVNVIIEDINKLEVGCDLEEKKENKIFQPVFDSLVRLKLRLNSVEKERRNIEEQRKEWIVNISHDMKTPLSSIKGYAEIMENDEYPVSTDEMHQYSQTIIRNADAIKNLIDELKFSRLLEDGEIKLQKDEINICTLLKECCEEIPSEFNEGNIKYDFEEELIYAFVDRELMRRCFVNIICNAIVHNSYQVDIVIGCKKSDKVIVKIADNGCGMSKVEQENIFNRYYRGKNSKNTNGSGLGLAIAKEVVIAHGGNIRVESEEGKGSTFIISI